MNSEQNTTIPEKAILQEVVNALAFSRIDEEQVWPLLADLGIGVMEHDADTVAATLRGHAERNGWPSTAVESVIERLENYNKPDDTVENEETEDDASDTERSTSA